MATEEGLQALGDREVDDEGPRIAQDYDKAIEWTALPVMADRAEVASIDLSLLSRGGFKMDGELLQTPMLLTQRAQVIEQDQTTCRYRSKKGSSALLMKGAMGL